MGKDYTRMTVAIDKAIQQMREHSLRMEARNKV